MLGEYLKKYRLSKNLTQEQMAKLLGMRQCNYSRLENNKLHINSIHNWSFNLSSFNGSNLYAIILQIAIYKGIIQNPAMIYRI